MSDMLSYEAVQLRKLLAEEKDIRNRYIPPPKKYPILSLRKSCRNAPQYTAVTSAL